MRQVVSMRRISFSAAPIPMWKNIILTSSLPDYRVLFTEDVGGAMMLEFAPDGTLEFRIEAEETDYLFDEIGSGLKVKQYQREKRELLESLELYYKVFILGIPAEQLLEEREEDGEEQSR